MYLWQFDCYCDPQNFPTAPNQHHLSSDLRAEPGNTGPLSPPDAFSHIHSKTACRGFKSFCPCQKSQVSLLRYLTFSLVSGKIWQQGAPAGPPAVRVVGRWSPVATVQRRPRRQPRPSPSAPAKKPAKTLGFCRFSFCTCCMVKCSLWFGLLIFSPASSASNRCYSLQHPKRTRFRLFRAFPGAFFSFSLFLGRKISGLTFVQPAI